MRDAILLPFDPARVSVITPHPVPASLHDLATARRMRDAQNALFAGVDAMQQVHSMMAYFLEQALLQSYLTMVAFATAGAMGLASGTDAARLKAANHMVNAVRDGA